MLGQLFDKPGSEKGLTVKKAVELQKKYKESEREPKSKTEPKITGSTEQTTKKGAKPPRRNKGTITYPANAAQNRDYLCIKAIEYITPQSRGTGDKFGAGGGLQVKTSALETAVNTKTKEKYLIKGSGGLTWKFGKGSSQRSKKAKKTLYTVNLPIPQQVSDNLGVTWGESTMNLFELAGLQVAQDFMESPAKAMSAYASQVKSTMEAGDGEGGLGLSQDVQRSFQAALSGTALNSLGSNVTAGQVISRSTGQVLNSNRELIFEGVQLRTFPFNIQFSPRDAGEAAIVLEIIRNFKQSMSPKKGEGAGALGGKGTTSSGGAFIKAPDVFLLEYRKGGQKHPFLNSFKVCALTSMAVNYTGAGTYATYNDSTPVKVTIDLSFKELEPIYNDDYKDVTEGVGY